MSGCEEGTNKPPRRSRSPPLVDERELSTLNEKELDRTRTTLGKYDDVKLLKTAVLTLLEEKICEKNKKDLQTVKLRDINRVLEKDKEYLEEFARRSACPNKLRYVIEIFPKRYLFSIDEANRRQAELHKTLTEKLNPISRQNYLCQCIRQFALLTLKPVSSVGKEFESTWNRLKDLKYGFSYEATKNFSAGSLLFPILSLYNVDTLDKARAQWSTDESLWKSRSSELTEEDGRRRMTLRNYLNLKKKSFMRRTRSKLKKCFRITFQNII